MKRTQALETLIADGLRQAAEYMRLWCGVCSIHAII